MMKEEGRKRKEIKRKKAMLKLANRSIRIARVTALTDQVIDTQIFIFEAGYKC